jgi:hypothetical protein
MIRHRVAYSYSRCLKVVIHFKSDDSVLLGILSDVPQHVGTDHCHSCLKSYRKILDSMGRDCINHVHLGVCTGKRNSLELYLAADAETIIYASQLEAYL